MGGNAPITQESSLEPKRKAPASNVVPITLKAPLSDRIEVWVKMPPSMFVRSTHVLRVKAIRHRTKRALHDQEEVSEPKVLKRGAGGSRVEQQHYHQKSSS